MSLKGNLETFFLNSILQLLCDDQKSGVLQVKNHQKEVKIYFQDGEIVYATGNQRESRLGYHLQSKGAISRKKLHECLEAGQKQKKALGKVLVEKGYITAENLGKIIRDQIEEIIFDLFIWGKGDFEYKDANLNLQGMVITRLNVVKLLLEASRRIDEMSILRKNIPNDKVIFTTAEQVKDNTEIKLNANEWKALRLIDGTRSVRQFIEESGFDEFMGYKILYSLLSSGLIENGPNQAPAKEARVEHDYSVVITIYSDILQTIGRSLEGEVGKQMFQVFEQCKPVLSAQFSELFKAYNPNNPTATNIHFISQQLKAIDDYEEGRNILIKGFNTFIENILNNIPSILGNQFTETIVHEIDKLLDYVDTYQASSSEKNYIINEVQKIILSATASPEAKGDGKSKSGGLFSRIRKG
jgi:hypothetical protein